MKARNNQALERRNMAERHFLFLGHSHTGALRAALQDDVEPRRFRDVQIDVVNLYRGPFMPDIEPASDANVLGGQEVFKHSTPPKGAAPYWFGASDQTNRLTASFKTNLRAYLQDTQPDHIICMCRGNEHAVMSMLQHPRAFRVDVQGARPRSEPCIDVIPQALIRAQIRQIASNNGLLFWNFLTQSCRDIHHGSVSLLPPPPPIACEKHIRAHPGRFGDLAKAYGISPASLRAQIWRMYCAVLQEAAQDANRQFINLPAALFDDDGCLAPQYWSDDPTHGNAQYGGVILDHVLAQTYQTAMARHG